METDSPGASADQAAAPPAVAVSPLGWGSGDMPPDHWCPDKANHKVCPKSDDGHDWYKPNPRPEDHKYQCLACGHYDLDDYM